jgi:hypothetical protein
VQLQMSMRFCNCLLDLEVNESSEGRQTLFFNRKDILSTRIYCEHLATLSSAILFNLWSGNLQRLDCSSRGIDSICEELRSAQFNIE